MTKDQLQNATFAARAALAVALATLAFGAFADTDAAPPLRYSIVAQHPHDVGAFTQGLLFHEGRLLESVGGWGRSELREVHRQTGAIVRRRALAGRHFGEGIAVAGGRLVQLTWRSGLALRYDAATLAPAGAWRYGGEGWGLAFDGREFLMSNGSHRIQRRAAADFAPIGGFAVTDGGQPVRLLNELEYAGGWLYANVWRSDRIAVIDPADGRVAAWLDLSALKSRFDKPPAWQPGEHVLNGIAADPATGHLWVTGKCWPALFELRAAPPPR